MLEILIFINHQFFDVSFGFSERESRKELIRLKLNRMKRVDSLDLQGLMKRV